ncbi:MAG: protein phosphatase 2C domain-containing protein [Myxococcota bacterium]
MKPIRDIGAVHRGSVLYHSAFGFARVADVEPVSVVLEWDGEADNLPGRVSHDVLMRVYALCTPGGFFDRALNDREGVVEQLAGQPVETLHLLLGDLNGPQSRHDLIDWIVGRELMSAEAAHRWWESLRTVIEADERFSLDNDTLSLAREEATAGPEARLRNPALSPARRLDLALALRSELSDDVFLENLVLAWKTGGSQVRDLALQAASGFSAERLLEAMLAPGPDGIEAIIHMIRRASWGADDVSPSGHALLLDRVVKGCDAGGPLDNEGRLAATLARWESPGIVETLADLASTPDGKRLVRATLAALPPRRAESLAIQMLGTALASEAIDAATWLSGELLGIALVDQHTMAERLDDENAELAAWFRHTFQGIQERGLTYEDLTDDSTAHTAEIDLSEIVEGPVPLSRLPPRSGASLLGLGLAISRALAAHHKDGRVCNPSADRTLVLPNETMEIAPGDDGDIPRPAGEPPSASADVYIAAVLLLECLLGRRWPRHIPAQRAVPYLRYVIPLLPPAALAPLDAALHPEPQLRPRDGLAWQALWQVAAIAEEKRSYAQRDPAARLQIGYDSHIGRTKVLLTQTNQDALFVSTKGPLSLLVVCDGISTANAGTGDVASSIASHVIANLWEQALPRLVQAGPAEIREFLDRALKMANQAVCEAALRFAGGSLDGRVPMGTTAVVALVYGNRVWLAWLGDSRSYLVGPYGASLLTFDENQASERLRAWHLNFIENWDPAGFALVGYLGHFDEMARAEALPAHHFSFTLVPGERLVLCSDGVTDYLGDTHPEAALFVADAVRDDDPFEASRNLVAQANRGGGGDNITTIVARLWEQ